MAQACREIRIDMRMLSRGLGFLCIISENFKRSSLWNYVTNVETSARLLNQDCDAENAATNIRINGKEQRKIELAFYATSLLFLMAHQKNAA
jgi:hypothetical protein